MGFHGAEFALRHVSQFVDVSAGEDDDLGIVALDFEEAIFELYDVSFAILRL